MDKPRIIKTQLFPTFLTLFVIGFLLVVGPTSVIGVSIFTPDFEIFEKDVATFEIGIDIGDVERVNLQYLALQINDFNGQVIDCEFAETGALLNCDPAIQNITRIRTKDILGYGYSDDEDSLMRFIVNWESPFVQEDSTFDVEFSAITEDSTYYSEDNLAILVKDRKYDYIETVDLASFSKQSYTTGSYTGNYGFNWFYQNSRLHDGTYAINDNGILLGGLEYNATFSSEINTGIDVLSIDVKKAYSSAAPRQIEVFINGESIGKLTPFTESDTVYTFFVKDLKTAGNFNLMIQNLGEQVVIDDISWTSYPALTQQNSTDEPIVLLSTRRSGSSGNYTGLFNQTPEDNETIIPEAPELNTTEEPLQNISSISSSVNQSTLGGNNQPEEELQAPPGLTGQITGNLPTILGSLLGLVIIGGLIFFWFRKKNT